MFPHSSAAEEGLTPVLEFRPHVSKGAGHGHYAGGRVVGREDRRGVVCGCRSDHWRTFSLIGLAGFAGGLASDSAGGALGSALFGVGAIIILPIFYGAMGFVVTLISAWLFNIAAGITGGVEIEVRGNTLP